MVTVSEALQQRGINHISARNEPFFENNSNKTMSWAALNASHAEKTHKVSSIEAFQRSSHSRRYSSSISRSSPARWQCGTGYPRPKCPVTACECPDSLHSCIKKSQHHVGSFHCFANRNEDRKVVKKLIFLPTWVYLRPISTPDMKHLHQASSGRKRSAELVPVASVGSLVAASGAVTISTANSNPHSAVVSTLTQLAVTAIAIASGACLSTQVESLFPQNEASPEQQLLEGVDVTGYRIFEEPEVVKALTFAKEAHAGQMRKTGEPYLAHCVHTAKILAALVPESGNRAINTVVAGLLHDVTDDTGRDIRDIREMFGADVGKLVAGVSKLSHINQLLRRHRRTSVHRSPSSDGGLTQQEVNGLRVMLLGMVNDPRVVLIKLADRLHNMRTIYALPPSKALAVAQETLAVWCSLASRLGVWAVKAELEDLCFAVLEPQLFCRLRAELAGIWNPDKDWRYFKRITKRPKRKALMYGEDVDEQQQRRDMCMDEAEPTMKELLESVIPFDVLEDRQKRRSMLGMLTKSGSSGKKKTKIMQDAEVALASLAACEEALERELLISTSYIPGMEVTLSGRLKSLYSTYSKMKRKSVAVDQIYDARALRVVVGDGNGELHVAAVEGCYSALCVVHRLWTPIGGEFDDYILNPKPSKYQSLHTAVQGPEGAPLEVQIRTHGMHEHAEYGHAAHWLYKESEAVMKPPLDGGNISSHVQLEVSDASNTSELQEAEDTQAAGDNNPSCVKSQSPPMRSIRLGHPVLRVEDGRLLAGVILRVDRHGKDLLVATSFALHSREVAAGRSGNQKGKWTTYAQLYKKVTNQWWFAPGHGDWSTWLEKYTLCSDGIYHKQDQFDRPLATFIQLLELDEEEAEEYWEVLDRVLKGEEINTLESSQDSEKMSKHVETSITTETRLNNKVRLLRSMLQWEKQLFNKAAAAAAAGVSSRDTTLLSEVLVVRWPDGEIMRMPSGSTAADAAWRMGMEGTFIFVNSQVAPPHVQLQDGDIVEVRI